MESWRLELYRNELYHHGIQGQKWGVRNGPPYPLSTEAKRRYNEDRREGHKHLMGGVAVAGAGIGFGAAAKTVSKLNTYNKLYSFAYNNAPISVLNRVRDQAPQFVHDLLKTPLGMVLTSPFVNSLVRGPAISIIKGSLFVLSAGLNAYGIYKYIRSGIGEGSSNPNDNSVEQIMKDALKAIAIGAVPVLLDGVISMTPIRRFVRGSRVEDAIDIGMKAVNALSKVGVMQASMNLIEDASAEVTRFINNRGSIKSGVMA